MQLLIQIASILLIMDTNYRRIHEVISIFLINCFKVKLSFKVMNLKYSRILFLTFKIKCVLLLGIEFESTMTMHARLMTRQRNTENYQMLYEKLSTEIKLSIAFLLLFIIDLEIIDGLIIFVKIKVHAEI